MLQSAGIAAGVALSLPLAQLLSQAPAAAVQATPPPPIPPDPTKTPGLPSGALGERSPFEQPALAPLNVMQGATNAPLHKLRGTITPSDLHFQRHHNGIALIDPTKYSLTVHGLVDRPLTFSLDELKRFPSETRTYFVECSGNGRSAYRTPKPEMTPQDVDGMTSNAEWTGVLVSTLLREAGAKTSAKWVLAEGGDAALLSRSIPMEKMQGDAMIAYAQNGEPVRAANGYPARLLLPGYEGNMCIKWLRRLEVISEPNMSRDETVKYTDPLPDGTSRQFSFVMDAKSIITGPAYPEKLSGAGWWPITGLAWTGRGKISRVDVSVDAGRSWQLAEIVGSALPYAHTRFQYMWKWDGKPATLMSRAHDETGYVQPTLEEYRRVRGKGTDYHFNAIRSWTVAADGTVGFGG
ncbi:MAG: oxidoreductase molybdopterin binding protein [Gemmatimonadetes bacterium]|nr:oxidoreductase molybdopterin binding protein [Gemmatimonadota bacterium]